MTQENQNHEYWLFVCSSGEQRSPLMASIAQEIIKEKGLSIRTSYLKGGLIYATDKQKQKAFAEASRIYVMEKFMEDIIGELYDHREKIMHLDISTDKSKSDLEKVAVDVLFQAT